MDRVTHLLALLHRRLRRAVLVSCDSDTHAAEVLIIEARRELRRLRRQLGCNTAETVHS
jgi:hypothetical protein